jgi:toxin YoeB
VKLSWTDHAWDDYLYWQTQDRKTLKRINVLIADIKQDPDGPGIGKPELLRNNLAGLRPRRIDDEHRLGLRGRTGRDHDHLLPVPLRVSLDLAIAYPIARSAAIASRP